MTATAPAAARDPRLTDRLERCRSVYELLQEVADGHPDMTAYRSRTAAGWDEVTWAACRREVHRIARALIALGVDRGDRVTILAQTRLEWVECDLGIQSCGAVTVGIYHSLLAADCAYVVNHSGAEVLFVEDDRQLRKILSVREDLPRLRHLVVFDGPSDPETGVIGWDEFLAAADAIAEERVAERGRSLERDDLAALVYTSGTTGAPKGAMITHGNLLFSVWSASHCLDYRAGYTTLMFLPLAHVFARLILLCCVANTNTVSFCSELDKLGDYFREVRPHFVCSVPRVYEKAHERIVATVERESAVKRSVFEWAVGVGREAGRLLRSRRPLPAVLRLKHRLATRLVLRRIQEGFGGRLAWAVSGSAPLNPAIAEFFEACGVTILEGIGMTENTSFSNVNRLDANKIGTVGPAGPGIEVKLADDGEVLFRAPNVMKGYFGDPEATAETITADGWLRSGDIGEIDDEGYLRITDRKKDLIITAGGKNVAPQRVERVLRASPFINHVVVHGDRRKYLTALVTLDRDAVAEWAVQHGIEGRSVAELASHPRVRELLAREIEEGNAELASFETVKRFHVLPRDLTIEDGELTPTMKVKRKAVCEKYARELEALYAEGSDAPPDPVASASN